MPRIRVEIEQTTREIETYYKQDDWCIIENTICVE